MRTAVGTGGLGSIPGPLELKTMSPTARATAAVFFGTVLSKR